MQWKLRRCSRLQWRIFTGHLSEEAGGYRGRPSAYAPERLYAFLFYFIVVGCGEEFVFRGYLHNELRKTFNFKMSVILGGLLFGFAHGYSHYMIQGGTIMDILSELGGGIVGALLFSTIYEKSGSIGWPILVHTCLDFVGYLI